MATTKATPITRGTIKTLRADATKAIQDVMTKHGLMADLGRITFEPGLSFRCKLTVTAAADPTAPKAVPVVGEVWFYGSKSYRIVSVGLLSVVGARFSRTRRFGLVERQYRIKRDSFMAAAYKVTR